MRISIVGTSYVGLVTGISLVRLGHKVVCIDNDKDKIEKIKDGQPPFYEPGIDKALKDVFKKKALTVTDNLEKAVLESDITIVAVGTPTINNKIDLSYIKKAAKQIGSSLGKSSKYHVVAIKSTVLPGVTEKIVKPVLEKYSRKKVGKFGLCMNPEFLREGSALEDALHPDRIVIGQIDKKSGKEFAKIYNKVSCPIIFTNLSTAEMTKYAANSLLATLISYSNEIARISEITDNVDVVDVWKGVHLDRRLTPKNSRIKPGILSYIFSGCGFGGSCFPKDIKALSSFADQSGLEAKLIKSVIYINETQPQRVILLLKKALGKNLKNNILHNKKIAVLGLTFKPDTDDLRESPAFPIINQLLLGGAKVFSHDPMAYKEKKSEYLKSLPIILTDTIKEAIKDADAAIIVTSWADYKKLTPKFFKKNMKKPIVVDGRRIYDKNLFLSQGISYKGIGL